MTYVNWNRKTLLSTGSDSNVEGAVIRSAGKHVSKTITLSANNTSASVNVFQLTGSCEIMGLHGEVTVATTLTNLTNGYFDLWDGTNSVPITKTTGCTMSGFGVGSFFLKDADVANSLSTLQNDQCRIKEASTGAKVNANLMVIQKLSTNTYIRFRYTTTDAPINASLEIRCVYADIDNGTIIAV